MSRRFKPADSHIKAVVGKWVNDNVAAGGWPTPEQFEEFLKYNVNDNNRSIFCCPGKDSVTRLGVLAVRTRLQHLKKSSDLRAEVSFHLMIDCLLVYVCDACRVCIIKYELWRQPPVVPHMSR